MPEQGEEKKASTAPLDVTKSVLLWLDKVLTEADTNPAVLLKAKADIDRHKDIIRRAIEDALLDEFKPYAELVAKALGG
ncbi:MAG: hypothetical protein J7K48_08050 [Thermococcus sp.]|nr:hypothetical protein [Thermococcus sp.]